MLSSTKYIPQKICEHLCTQKLKTKEGIGVVVKFAPSVWIGYGCQGRCNHEPILHWPPCLNELQRTTTMSAGEQTPTKLRQNQVIPTPTHKRRLPNASRLAASGAESHFR